MSTAFGDAPSKPFICCVAGRSQQQHQGEGSSLPISGTASRVQEVILKKQVPWVPIAYRTRRSCFTSTGCEMEISYSEVDEKTNPDLLRAQSWREREFPNRQIGPLTQHCPLGVLCPWAGDLASSEPPGPHSQDRDNSIQALRLH